MDNKIDIREMFGKDRPFEDINKDICSIYKQHNLEVDAKMIAKDLKLIKSTLDLIEAKQSRLINIKNFGIYCGIIIILCNAFSMGYHIVEYNMTSITTYFIVALFNFLICSFFIFYYCDGMHEDVLRLKKHRLLLRMDIHNVNDVLKIYEFTIACKEIYSEIKDEKELNDNG